jgi:hypothetical protein
LWLDSLLHLLVSFARLFSCTMLLLGLEMTVVVVIEVCIEYCDYIVSRIVDLV